jgi:glycosyltransferase involved in cell wall biosynthesis
MTKYRTVVDVSDLINWNGNLSGIQRVVAEMAYRYEKNDALFCYYDESTRTFYELDSFSGLMENRKKVQSQAGLSSKEKNQRFKNIQRVVKIQFVPLIAQRAGGKIKRFVAENVKSEPEVEGRKLFKFNNEDRLLVFGAHWDKPHYIDTLTAIKQTYSLKISHNINDIIPIVDKGHVAEEEHVRFPKYIDSISRLSETIFVISEATKKDYIRFLKENNIKQPIIKKITLGENYTSTEPVKPLHFDEKNDYILMVGTLEVRKNHALLYSTYKLAYEKGIQLPKLVIVGRRGWLSGDIYYQMVHDNDVNDKFIFLNNTNDSELSWLYQNCKFTVFAAFYEGWGLPIAEAAHYGKVSALSNTSSIPEVVGKAAVYFSPYSSDECLSALQILLDSKSLSKYEALIGERKPATWDETYTQTIKS